MEIPDNALGFANAVNAVRRQMADANIPASFEITLKASGRIHDGDAKIEWYVDAGGWEKRQSATGASLSACVTEVLRRHGWQELHAPVCIGYDTPATVD